MALTDRAKNFLQQREQQALTPRAESFLGEQFPTLQPRLQVETGFKPGSTLPRFVPPIQQEIPQITQRERLGETLRETGRFAVEDIAGIPLGQQRQEIGGPTVGGVGRFFAEPTLRALKAPAGATKALAEAAFTEEGRKALSDPELFRKKNPLVADVIELPPEEQLKTVVGRTFEAGASISPFLPGVFPLGSAKGAFAKGAGITGLASFGKNLEDQKSIGEAATKSVEAGVLGGLAFLGTYGLTKMINSLVNNAPEKLYRSALKQSKADLEKEIANKAPNLSKQLIDQGVTGRPSKILSESLTSLNQLEDDIGFLVNRSDKKINTKLIADSLDDQIKLYENVLGPDSTEPILQLKQRILAKGKDISLKEALSLKRDIYKLLPQSSFRADPNLSKQSDALRTVANTLMKEIGKTSKGLKDLTAQQQMWLRTAQAMENQIQAAGKRNIIGLSDTILAGSALAPGGSISALIGAIGRKFFETTTAKTNIAQALDVLGKIPVPGTQLGQIGAVGLSRLFSRPDTQQQQQNPAQQSTGRLRALESL